MNVYMCQNCSTVVEGNSEPNQGNCSVGSGGQWPQHSWYNLGKSGGISFNCGNCGKTVKTYSEPSIGGCPVGGGGQSRHHSWTNLGGSNTASGSMRSGSRSSSSEDVKFSDTLIGMAASGTGKLAGKAASEVGSYAWKKMTGQKSEEDIAREKHNMELKQAKEQLKQNREDRKEAKKEANRNRRNERAKELEAEGKAFAAFWVRNQRWLLPLVIIIGMIIIGQFMDEEQPKTQETKTEMTVDE